MAGFYVFQTIRSVLNWHILRISSGTGKAWNMPEYQNMKRLLYPVYSRNCLSISDYGLGRRLPRILRMNSDKKRSNPLTDDESISVTAHVITNRNCLYKPVHKKWERNLPYQHSLSHFNFILSFLWFHRPIHSVRRKRRLPVPVSLHAVDHQIHIRSHLHRFCVS